jgi:hypothetical protein
MSDVAEVDRRLYPRCTARDEPGLNAHLAPGGGVVFVPEGKILLWRRSGKLFKDREPLITTTLTIGEPWRDSK